MSSKLAGKGRWARGDVAIVGASADSENGSFAGAAYLYRFDPVCSAWVEETKLLAKDGAPNSWFGVSVAISNDIALAGASAVEVEGEIGVGAAYVFRFVGDDHADILVRFRFSRSSSPAPRTAESSP